MYLEAGVQVAEGGELPGAARAQPLRGARAHAALVHVRHGRPAAEPGQGNVVVQPFIRIDIGRFFCLSDL